MAANNCYYPSAMVWAALVVAGVVAYVLSLSVAFLVMYRVGPRFPARLAMTA